MPTNTIFVTYIDALSIMSRYILLQYVLVIIKKENNE